MLLKLFALKEAYVTPVLKSFAKDIKGATAIEYGLIAGGISLAIVAAVFAFGGDLKALFSTMSDKMAEARTDAEANLQ
jgi:pilus assembly protein Flp/PilA